MVDRLLRFLQQRATYPQRVRLCWIKCPVFWMSFLFGVECCYLFTCTWEFADQSCLVEDLCRSRNTTYFPSATFTAYNNGAVALQWFLLLLAVRILTLNAIVQSKHSIVSSWSYQFSWTLACLLTLQCKCHHSQHECQDVHAEQTRYLTASRQQLFSYL